MRCCQCNEKINTNKLKTGYSTCTGRSLWRVNTDDFSCPHCRAKLMIEKGIFYSSLLFGYLFFCSIPCLLMYFLYSYHSHNGYLDKDSFTSVGLLANVGLFVFFIGSTFVPVFVLRFMKTIPIG